MARWMATSVACTLLAAIVARGGTTDAQGARSSAGADKVLFQKSHGPKRGYHNLLVKDKVFGDFVFEAALRRSSGVTHYGLVFRCKDAQNLYRLVLRTGQKDFRVEKMLDGVSDYATTRYVRFPSESNHWYRVRLVVSGPHVEVWIDGKQMYSHDGFGEVTGGRVGFTVFDRALAEFDDVRITSLDGKTELFRDDFDGGSLARWAVASPEGVKGVWAVQPKMQRRPGRKDFVEHYAYNVCEAMGRNQSMFEFPGVTRLRDGSLLTVFIEENQHGTPPWAAMPSSGILWMARSTDLGRSWSQRTGFLDTPFDDRHCYTLQLANGDLLASFWVQYVAHGLRGVTTFCTLSHDGGLTWEDPWRMTTPKPQWPPRPKPGIRGGATRVVPPIQLPDGSLAVACTALGPDNRVPPEVALLRSHDGGRTWGDYTTIACDPERCASYVEPAGVRLPNGKWICVMRTEVPINPGTTHPYTLGPNLICKSTDDGRTWSKAVPLPLDFAQRATAPFILCTKTGVVVYVVNTGLAFSYDEGETWVPQETTCGYYPNLLEIEPGTLATIACGMGGRVLGLTRPKKGTPPPAGTPTPKQLGVPKPRRMPRIAAPLRRIEPLGMFRAIRVRGVRDAKMSPLLAQAKHPVLAVARAKGRGAAEMIAGVLRKPKGEWTQPFLVAKAPGLSGEPVVAQACDGTLLCAFPVGKGVAAKMMLATSKDGGGTWSASKPMAVAGAKGRFLVTAPPVEQADGSWLVAASNGIFRSGDGCVTWQHVGDLPGKAGRRLTDPSLAPTRDGRWVVIARDADGRGRGQNIVVVISSDQGKTWCAPRATGLKGQRPEIVELLATVFVATAEGGGGRLLAAYGWEDLDHFIIRPLSSGYCVRFDGQKVLARGSGVDVAGEHNYVEQVPLRPQEIAAARKQATRRVPASDKSFRFKGEWEALEGGGQKSSQVAAWVQVAFEGPTVFLVHDVVLGGRLVSVYIDGREYPPVDMKGNPKKNVSTCLATGLSPGKHKLLLKVALRWRTGAMSVRGIDVRK